MPICVNSTSAETAATISGVTSGISISTLALPAQRVRARTSPNASVVPSDGGHHHRHERDLDAGHERLAQRLVLEEALVPLEAEALEVLERAGRVEREQGDQRDRGEQEHEEERREHAQEAGAVEASRCRPAPGRGLATAVALTRRLRRAPPSAGRGPSRSRGTPSARSSERRRRASSPRRGTAAGSGSRPCRSRGRPGAAR